MKIIKLKFYNFYEIIVFFFSKIPYVITLENKLRLNFIQNLILIILILQWQLHSYYYVCQIL